MYVLYYEDPTGHLEWICALEDEQRARSIAQTSAKLAHRPVKLVQNREDGHTQLLASYGAADGATRH